ncbi:hypothetical protein DICSQDRAFT_169974 [Dichomitus squalens LYAD-421 SS1]|uniref:Uncharacterized protein n=1 Tax=Dichomitus squalens (strain LYAD-421) TaxID=732165 RepID=R7T015_DICSQ|nr:uncharacterized protein DICSQDRAFT_169974 [Dichomitus squalens LYAD-421 SS1]EJF61558.1 hypothetical protein DICSQDRAFT_169974 [Dichomitus squalens LYAD-421 SS1]
MSVYGRREYYAPRSAVSYRRAVSPPPMCIDPKLIDPGIGLPDTEEGWLQWPLCGFLPGDSSPDSSPSPPGPSSDSDSTPPPQELSSTLRQKLYVGRKLQAGRKGKGRASEKGGASAKAKASVRGSEWGTQMLKCKWCSSWMQARTMGRHVKHKHPPQGTGVPASARTCTRCGAVLSRPDALQRHERICQ